MTRAPIVYVCKDCGSRDVGGTASVRWDVERQKWTISGLFDDTWCESCGEDARLVPMDAAALVHVPNPDSRY
jgi:hypothetical protein